MNWERTGEPRRALGCPWRELGVTGRHWDELEGNWDELGDAGEHWAALGGNWEARGGVRWEHTGLYWSVLVCTGLYWSILVCTGPYWRRGR